MKKSNHNLNKKLHNKDKLVPKFLILGMCALLAIFTMGLVWSDIEYKSVFQDYQEANGEIIVMIKDDARGEDLIDFLLEMPLSITIERHIDNYLLLSTEDVSTFASVSSQLKEHSLVELVQANAEIKSMGIPNDPYLDTQWAINNPGYYYYYAGNGGIDRPSKNDIDMDIVEAWKYMKVENPQRREVVVAIIDTGVDYTHPDLADNMWVNPMEVSGDGLDNDNNGYIDDIHGWDFYNNDNTVAHYEYDEEKDRYVANSQDNDDHGTHIAGVVGAVSNNKIGVAGLASNIDIKIMSLKINGGSGGTGYISNAVEAIKYATMMGADICNISWGTSKYNEALEKVMRDSDMLFVTAAGNDGTNNNSSPVYPANYKMDNLISVSFVDSQGLLSKYSNYGATTVDIVAPGYNIYSTVVGDYAYMSGSSMAVPHITALAALLYSYDDGLYPANVKEIILNNIKPIEGLEGYILHAGIPSALLAVQASESLVKDQAPPRLKLRTIYDKGKFTLPIISYDVGGSEIRTIRYMRGIREIEDFKRGMEGIRVDDNQITVIRAGDYTFYASDYAGNEMVIVYKVEEDKEPPTIITNYSISDNYDTRKVTVLAQDEQSDIRRVKYMKGKKGVEDFLPASAGNNINIKNGRGTFEVKDDGIYSVYAIDNRGNASIEQVDVRTIRSTDIKLARISKGLDPGDSYIVRPFIKPFNSTDKLQYYVNDQTVAKVSPTGQVQALKKGTTHITVRTNSGLQVICEIIVS